MKASLQRLGTIEKMELGLSKYGMGVWMRFPASIDNSIGVLTGLRFTKSGIESVILAGSSIFALSEAKSWILTLEQCPWRAQRAIFSMILIFWLRKLKNFAGPQGPVLRVASHHCKYWNSIGD